MNMFLFKRVSLTLYTLFVGVVPNYFFRSTCDPQMVTPALIIALVPCSSLFYVHLFFYVRTEVYCFS